MFLDINGGRIKRMNALTHVVHPRGAKQPTFI